VVAGDLRRVRKLRLAASSEALVRRGAILLEDALRTASLSVGESGRFTVVRTLNLGAFDARESPSSLALRIDQSFRRLRFSAVSARDRSAARSASVCFSDELEPHCLMAERISRGEKTSEWFWRSALPGWSRTSEAGADLRSLLLNLIERGRELAAMIRMLNHIERANGMDLLLSSLSESDGDRLCVAFRLARNDRVSELESAPQSKLSRNLSPARYRQVQQWSQQWGVEDARSLWLASTTLMKNRLDLIEDPRLSRRARALLDELVTKTRERERDANAPQDPVSTAPDVLSVDQSGVIDTQSSHIGAAPASNDPSCRDRSAEDQPPAAAGHPHPLNDHPEPQLRNHDLESDPRAIESTIPLSSQPPPDTGLELAADDSISCKDVPVSGQENEIPTSLGGLPLLIPFLEELGISRFLEQHPHLKDSGLGTRILRHVGRVCGPEESSPWSEALPLDDLDELPFDADFAVPGEWRSLLDIKGEFRVSRIEGSHRSRCLTSHHDGMPIAVWRNRSPDRVRSVLGEVTLKRSCSPLSEVSHPLVMVAWRQALQLLARMRVDMDLDELVCRRATVRFSETHIDIVFPLSEVNLEIRRAGLDLDPGWVPWLGRIVAIHFAEGA